MEDNTEALNSQNNYWKIRFLTLLGLFLFTFTLLIFSLSRKNITEPKKVPTPSSQITNQSPVLQKKTSPIPAPDNNKEKWEVKLFTSWAYYPISEFILQKRDTNEVPQAGGPPCLSAHVYGPINFREWFCTYFEDERDALLEHENNETGKWELADIMPEQKEISEDKLYCRWSTADNLYQYIYVPVYSQEKEPKPITPGTYRLKYTIFTNCKMEEYNAPEGRNMISSPEMCENKKEIESEWFKVVDDIH